MRFVLTCCKTGRFFRYASEGQCRRAALTLGWKDYEIHPEVAP
jgi:hypothetical protein